MNAKESAAAKYNACVAVLGRGEEFVLVGMDHDIASQRATAENALHRGYFHCGTLSWTNGQLFVALTPDLRAVLPMQLAAVAFMAMAGAPPPTTLRNDLALSELRRLSALADPRAQRA